MIWYTVLVDALQLIAIGVYMFTCLESVIPDLYDLYVLFLTTNPSRMQRFGMQDC